MTLIAQVIWFLIPAGVANLVPPISAKLLPRWDSPMDFGVHWRGQQLLGSHKTVRGLVTGTLMALLVHHGQVLLALRSDWLADLAISPAYYHYWWLGAWLGFTALLGDALKSLAKRQLNIEPGKPWLPWDKIDWILGCLAGCWFLLPISTAFALTAIVCGLVLSSAGRIVGYWLKINDDWL
jgi:CDP-2,3-bis-(O-geranylgeranyl)-sn-glycerol synthase